MEKWIIHVFYPCYQKIKCKNYQHVSFKKSLFFRLEKMPTTAAQQLSAIERKLQNRNGVTVKRAKSFSSSAPTSPSTFRRKKAPALEPR